VVALALLGSAAACSRTLYHEVRPGENLYRISKAYGVPIGTLAQTNGLADPSRLEVGQRLRIPGARRGVPVSLVTPRTATVGPPQRGGRPYGAGKLSWPVVGGTVTSGFGRRGRSFHDGIDISAPAGAAVLAAEDGDVIYSDFLRGYGNVIIVRHREGLATVYAHNQSNRVREGQRVRRGDVIAKVGDSGRTSGANLHFEVRQDNVAHDPLYFLPAVEQVAAPAPLAGGG
jgi:murein DD-endopeptidase MepM/ murein hydrolase activator NlpD